MEKETISKFIKTFKANVAVYKKKYKLERFIKEKLNRQFALRSVLKYKEDEKMQKKGKPLAKEFVFTLSKAEETFFELISLGKLPDNNYERWHTSEFIYPIGFKSRRIYVPYKPTGEEKMEYLCEINATGLSIKAGDGRLWEGPNVWNNFIKCFPPTFEFKCLEHFFGLNYKPIMYKIEKLGDLVPFTNYVKYEERKNN